MNCLQLDPIGGASGDMLLAALSAVGADLDAIAARLSRALESPVRLAREPAADRGLHGWRVRVHVDEAETEENPHIWPDSAAPAPTPGASCDPAHGPRDHAHGPHGHTHAHPVASPGHAHAPAGHAHGHAPHRGLLEVEAVLDRAALPPRADALARDAFRRLAAAEGDIHGKPPESVHFHEVGALDAIVDVAAACLAVESLDVGAFALGPLPCGTGTLTCAHGLMPNPAPATLRLLAGFEVSATDEPFELVTPTGAALLAAWRAAFPLPPRRLRLLRDGFGFGRRTLRGRPNALRAVLLEPSASSPAAEDGESLLELATNIDDCSPQWLGELLPRLLEAGARDAWIVPVTMKKGRPGMQLGVLCEADRVPTLEGLIFAATGTLGIRRHPVARTVLERREETVATPYGPVRVKHGHCGTSTTSSQPEFEDCARLGREKGVAPRLVADAARLACLARNSPPSPARSP